MPLPSRSTKITEKKHFFDFLKFYNELGKVKFFQLGYIRVKFAVVALYTSLTTDLIGLTCKNYIVRYR